MNIVAALFLVFFGVRFLRGRATRNVPRASSTR